MDMESRKVWMQCPACRGGGLMLTEGNYHKKCPYCDGKGIVTPTEYNEYVPPEVNKETEDEQSDE